MDRIKKLRKELKEQKLDALIVSHIPSIRYLTNFSGSSAILIILPKAIHFMTDGRYAEQVKTELFSLSGLEIHIERDIWTYIMEKNLLKKCETIGFEAEHTTVASLENMKKKLKPLKLKATRGIVEQITMIKTAEEVEHIRKAADLAAKVYDHILGFVKSGMTEKAVAAEISYYGKTIGSEGDAFDIIVASGERGALPHGRASDKKLKKGELITLDFGCIVNGFNSDMTRTFALGKPTKFDRSIFDLVYSAEMAAVQATKADINIRALDAVSRDIIAAAGYEKEFNHSLGHGLGIEVHERPGVSHRAPEKDVVLEGSVITIEPGVYIAGKCGVRIEDDVWVLKDGCDVLTSAPRELLIV